MAPMPLKLTGDGITMANIIAAQLLAGDLPALKSDEVARIVEQVAEDFTMEAGSPVRLAYHRGEVRDMDEYEAIYHRVIAEIEDMRGQ